MEWVIERGKTKEQAVDKALRKLGAKPEEVKVELLEENKGIFSFLGERSVKVKVSYMNPENSPQEVAQAPDEIKEGGETLSEIKEAKEVLETILEKMGIPSMVNGEESDDGLILTIRSEKGGLIIGRKGETLDALQYIVTKVIQKKVKRRMMISVDTEDYRRRREERVRNMAMAVASKVKNTRQSATLRNLSNTERKIIHTLFKEDPDIETRSKGDGMMKKLVITPRDKYKNEWIS